MDNVNNNTSRLPSWLKKRPKPSDQLHSLKSTLRCKNLHTVCEEARCPNIGECFERGTVTIMIMGNICTRRCGFCNVQSVIPEHSISHPRLRGNDTLLEAPDPDEPRRVAEQIRDMHLKHAVITSVTRDDLPDGGAAHFANTIHAIRSLCPETTIEVLTPDFEGREGDIRTVCNATPQVFNHNIETVERLTPFIRNKANYRLSLDVLRIAKMYLKENIPSLCPPEADQPLADKEGKGEVDQQLLHDLPHPSSPYKGEGLVKSGLMVGLGELEDEVETTLRDLKEAGCDIVTIGQYLRPSKNAIPVCEYINPKVFRKYEKLGLKLGFKSLFAGPFVRSSYMADKVLL